MQNAFPAKILNKNHTRARMDKKLKKCEKVIPEKLNGPDGVPSHGYRTGGAPSFP